MPTPHVPYPIRPAPTLPYPLCLPYHTIPYPSPYPTLNPICPTPPYPNPNPIPLYTYPGYPTLPHTQASHLHPTPFPTPHPIPLPTHPKSIPPTLTPPTHPTHKQTQPPHLTILQPLPESRTATVCFVRISCNGVNWVNINQLTLKTLGDFWNIFKQ